MIDPLVVLALQGFLATLLVVEGGRKLAPGNNFRAALASYGMVPRSLLPLAATLLALAEILSGMMIAMSIAAPFAFVIMLSYLAVIVRSISSGLAVADCGCSFGKRPSPLSRWHVVRAAVLAAASAIVYLNMPSSPIDWRSVQAVPAIGCLWLLYLACDQMISTAARLEPGDA